MCVVVHLLQITLQMTLDASIYNQFKLQTHMPLYLEPYIKMNATVLKK